MPAPGWTAAEDFATLRPPFPQSCSVELAGEGWDSAHLWNRGLQNRARGGSAALTGGGDILG